MFQQGRMIEEKDLRIENWMPWKEVSGVYCYFMWDICGG